MQLSLEQAAARMGKSVRQVRYMIQQGQLRARKDGGRWVVDSESLRLDEGAQQALERRHDQLKAAVEHALDVSDSPHKRRFSLTDLRAFKVGAAIFADARAALGDAHPAVQALHRMLEHLARGCHRFARPTKQQAYELARDEGSIVALELALADHPSAAMLRERVEQDLLGSMAGLLNRMDRRPRS